MPPTLTKTRGNADPVVDRLLWSAVFGLMVVGAAFIYSATAGADQAAGLHWWRYRVIGQIAAYIIGLGLVAGLCCVEYFRLARFSLVGYWAGIAALLAVPFFGVARLGARRWLDLGPIQFQPSEFAKLAFLFAMANYLSRPAVELASPAVFARALGMAGLPFILILKQPDLGSALVFIPVTLVMMFVAGVPPRFLLRLVGGTSAAVLLLVADILLAPPKYRFVKIEQYQRERLLVYFGLDFADAGATPAERLAARMEQDKKSYNVRQALISVGSGGFWGKGWREGTQGALGYLPRAVAHNDFIFSVIAEEKGFLGSVTVLTLYGLTLFRGIQMAGEARDRLGRLLAAGVVTLLFTHVFINIGMNIRLMPVTGIPLPLLSAGGTSVLCSLVAIGILQNIQIWRRR
jgi:rod shape determining protein RodA